MESVKINLGYNETFYDVLCMNIQTNAIVSLVFNIRGIFSLYLFNLKYSKYIVCSLCLNLSCYQKSVLLYYIIQ